MSNTKLISTELLCEADKSGRKFLRFFPLLLPPPCSVHSTTPQKQRWTVISPASLSMPLTYYIVFSSCVSPKFLLFNKTKVARLFFFLPTGEGERETAGPDLGKFERSRAKLVLTRNNCAQYIPRLGNFFQDEERIFGRKKRDGFRDILARKNTLWLDKTHCNATHYFSVYYLIFARKKLCK